MSWYKDPEPLSEGYWGPITSTLLWCEEKYKWSKYIAEPCNTISNLVYILLSLYGFQKTRQEKLPWRFSVSYLGMTLVGLGSTAFHATMRYDMQLLDELPMIYSSIILTYCSLETSKGYGNPKYPVLLPASLIAIVAWISYTYIQNGNPLFHEVAYAAIQLASTGRIIQLLTSTKTDFFSSQEALAKRRKICRLYFFGVFTFLTGFAIWNIDNIFCYWLRSARKAVGYPFAVLLEGHAWWHFLTCYGAYSLITAGAQLILSVKEHPDMFEIKGYWFPYVARVKGIKANGAPLDKKTG